MPSGTGCSRTGNRDRALEGAELGALLLAGGTDQDFLEREVVRLLGIGVSVVRHLDTSVELDFVERRILKRQCALTEERIRRVRSR